MKRRNGFVANSSASSFIIAIGKIIDKEKFDNFMSTIDSRVISGFELVSLNDIIEDKNWNSLYLGENGTKIIVEAFDGSTVSILKEDYLKDDHLDSVGKALKSLVGNDNKDIFVWMYSSEDIEYDENSGEYIYDIDLDHFDDDISNLYIGLKEENGVTLVEKNFGAGYA